MATKKNNSCGCNNKIDSCCGQTVTDVHTRTIQKGWAKCPTDGHAGMTYIGQRYITAFADPIEWSADRPYEQNVAVQRNGFTYLSKQPVPVGVDIENTEFWLLWADPNAQMEDLRQTVVKYDGRINDNAAAIENETTAREEADTSLQDSIAAETAAREEADTAETAAREEADTSLQDAIAAETAARKEADTAETAAREEADTALRNDLDSALETIDSTLVVAQFDGKVDYNTTCTVVKNDTAAILIETGDAADIDYIKAWFSGLGVERFDAWIITHYHGDHCGGYQAIIDSGYIDADTVIYEQMAPTSANDQYTTDYLRWRDVIVPAISAAGFRVPVVPTQGSKARYGNIDLEFWNTDPGFRTGYDTQAWANNGISDRRTTSINNYSLIVRFDCNGSSYVETGDVEGMAESNNAVFMKPANVARVPHHFVNKMGYELFFDKLKPDYWLVSNHAHKQQAGAERIDVYGWRTSYIFKYLVYSLDPTLVVTNISQNCLFEIKSGTVQNAQGHFIDKDYDPANDQSSLYTIWLMIPPNVYFNNPYEIYTITLLDWFKKCSRHFNGLHGGMVFYAQAYKEGVIGIANAQIAKDIRKFFKPRTMNGLFFLEITAPGINVWFNSFSSPYNRINIWTNAEFTELVYTFDWTQRQRANDSQYIFSGTLNNGDTVPDASWGYLKFARMLAVTLDTGARLTLLRKTPYPTTDVNVYSEFDGMQMYGNGLGVYRVYISAGGGVTIQSSTFNSGQTVNDRKITRIAPIM